MTNYASRRNYNRTPDRTGLWLGLICFLVVLLLAGIYVYNKDIKTGTTTLTVESKERTGGDHGKYMIFTTDDEAYTVSDNLFHGHFNSSNLYASLQPEHTYECTTTGWRLPLFSSYENLIACHEVTP